MGICLLVVNDDFTCRNIVSQVLQCCTYEELHTGRLRNALNAIWEKRDTLNPVLITNVQRLGEKGSQILSQIQNQLNFEIIYMTPDDKKLEWKLGEGISASAYVVNISNIEDMNCLWEFALAEEKAANQEGTSAQMASKAHDHVTEASRENTPSVGVGDGSGIHQKRKRKELKEKNEQNEASGDDHVVEKKPRVVWTKEMHRKFLEAIETLGPDKTFPKKIVELMNEPGLTRENVASHLQKYRMCLKRNQEEAANSNSGMNSCFPSFHYALSVNSLQRYSYVKPQTYGFQSSCGIISMPSFGLSRPFTGPRSSTCISNLRPADLPAGSNRGIHEQQLCTLSSSQAISEKNSFVRSANPQCSDQGGLMQMQSKYFTRHPVSSSFRIYGDETKNMLLSTEDGSSSSNATMPSNSEDVNSFIGLRLTSDGKSLEFGQTSVSGDNEIQTEMFSSVGTSGTQIPDHSNPLTSAGCSPENTLPQNGSHQNEVSDYCPSIFSDCTSEQEPFQALLESSVEKNVSHCPSLPIDCTFQQNHPLPHPCTSENPAEFLSPSTPGNHIPQQQSSPPFLEVPTSWNSNPTLPAHLPHPELSLPPLCTPGNVNSLQYPSVPPSGASMGEIAAHALSTFTPQQEIPFPLLGTSGNGASGQEPSTSAHQIPLQESSMPQMPSIQHELDNFRPVEDINAFLNDTAGCSSPQLFWEGVYDYAHLNHVN